MTLVINVYQYGRSPNWLSYSNDVFKASCAMIIISKGWHTAIVIHGINMCLVTMQVLCSYQLYCVLPHPN